MIHLITLGVSTTLFTLFALGSAALALVSWGEIYTPGALVFGIMAAFYGMLAVLPWMFF